MVAVVRERIPFHHRAKVLGLVSSGTSYGVFVNGLIRDELLFPMETAGRIWSIIGFTGMGGGFAMGVLSDRIGIRFSLAIT